jgi:diadenosine tetraphosphate (Ap4A) HIT family hydrolase
MFQDIEEKDKTLMGTLLLTAKKVAEQLNLINGYRLVINNGSNGCQHVYHLHIHIAGGEPCLSRECYGSWKLELGYETPTKKQMERREEEFMQILNKELPDKIIEENKEVIC